METKRRKLTSSEKIAAENLARIWGRKRKELGFRNQEQLGIDAGLGTQSVISQYMRGHIPLNTDAIIKFAQCLQVKPSEIQPGFDLDINATAKKNTQISSQKLSGAIRLVKRQYGEDMLNMEIDELSEKIANEYNSLPD